jgi:7-cyano-7-deazaguanine synthase
MRELVAKKASSIVLLSGGLDSAVALYWALNHGYEVETLTFDYFRRSEREIDACKAVSKAAGCSNRVFDLSFLKEIDDSKAGLRNPVLKNAPSAYIPCRNVIFYGIAASLAEVLDCRYLIGGHNKDDIRNFPDASPLFFESFNRTASIGRISKDRTGEVVLPLANLDKASVVRLGKKLGVPFEYTWSCYKSEKSPCGKCPACLLRAQAFREARIPDPLKFSPSQKIT